MKRPVLIFGLIAGLILAIFICIAMPTMDHTDSQSMATNMIIGYTVQLLAFSMIFFAIRQYRDKYHGGVISFGKAFQIGLWISLIGSAFYVITWAIVYKFIMPDFLEKFGNAQLQEAVSRKATVTEIADLQKQLDYGRELYSTWYGFAFITLCEILPTGIFVSLLAALIMKKKKKTRQEVLV